MYNHQYLAISSCLLFITWTGARNFPSCEVYVNGNETHLYSQTIKFRRYYQIVGFSQLNVTFVLPSVPDEDGNSFYNEKPPDAVWNESFIKCNTTPNCLHSYNYNPKEPIMSYHEESNNEIWIKPFAIMNYAEIICYFDVLISKESVAIEFELKWINENSLSMEITAGFPQPTEFSLICDGNETNAYLLNGIFFVNAEQLKFRSCQVVAKNYLLMKSSVDVPHFNFTTTSSTINFPVTVEAQQGEPGEDNSTVVQLSITLGCVVLVLLAVIVVIAVRWRQRRQLADEQPVLPPFHLPKDIESLDQKPPYMPSLLEDSHDMTTSFPDSSNSVHTPRTRTPEPVSMAIQENGGAGLPLVETQSPSTEEQFEVKSLASVEGEEKQVGKLDEHVE